MEKKTAENKEAKQPLTFGRLVKRTLYWLGSAAIAIFAVYTSGRSIKESEREELDSLHMADSIKNYWHIGYLKEQALYNRAEDSIKLLQRSYNDSLHKLKTIVYFSAKELKLPKGEIVAMYPPRANYRDLEKTKLYAVIRDDDNISHIVDLTARQWLNLKPNNILK